jgi:hypothetical protein
MSIYFDFGNINKILDTVFENKLRHNFLFKTTRKDTIFESHRQKLLKKRRDKNRIKEQKLSLYESNYLFHGDESNV